MYKRIAKRKRRTGEDCRFAWTARPCNKQCVRKHNWLKRLAVGRNDTKALEDEDDDNGDDEAVVDEVATAELNVPRRTTINTKKQKVATSTSTVPDT
jgi:hypothetical protein